MDFFAGTWSRIAAIAGVVSVLLYFTPALQFLQWIARSFQKALRRWRAKPRIRCVTRYKDKRLLDALDLYQRLLPEQEQDAAHDIVRWFQEIEAETKRGVCELKDYFLVAVLGGRVLALLYFHYYPEAQLLFVSCLAADENNKEVVRRHVTDQLANSARQKLKKDEKHLDGLVAEVHDPRRAKSQRERRSAEARIKRFKTIAQRLRVSLRELDMPYTQPRASLADPAAKETPMLLLYGRVGQKQLESFIEKSEGERVLRFIYETVYADQFAHDPDEDRRYREYLQGLLGDQLTLLPDQIPTSLTERRPHSA